MNNVSSGSFDSFIQNITIPSGMFISREEINELGRRGPYSRFVYFPDINTMKAVNLSGVKNE